MPRTTRLKRWVAAVLLVTLTSGIARADADDDRIAALQAKYRCPIFEYLVAIHKTPIKLKDRYLVVEINDPKAPYYTQCIFYARDRKMHCEAESAFYHPELSTYFAPQRLAALKALGYSTKPSKNNFHLERKVDGLGALYNVAGLYVETLARVFDLQIDETLSYRGPRVPAHVESSPETAKYCAPQISLR